MRRRLTQGDATVTRDDTATTRTFGTEASVQSVPRQESRSGACATGDGDKQNGLALTPGLGQAAATISVPLLPGPLTDPLGSPRSGAVDRACSGEKVRGSTHLSESTHAKGLSLRCPWTDVHSNFPLLRWATYLFQLCINLLLPASSWEGAWRRSPARRGSRRPCGLPVGLAEGLGACPLARFRLQGSQRWRRRAWRLRRQPSWQRHRPFHQGRRLHFWRGTLHFRRRALHFRRRALHFGGTLCSTRGRRRLRQMLRARATADATGARASSAATGRWGAATPYGSRQGGQATSSGPMRVAGRAKLAESTHAGT